MRITFLLFVFVIFLFHSCSNNQEYKELLLNDLSKPITDTLNFSKEGNISGVEIIIEGYVKGKGYIEFENGSGRYNKIYLENKVHKAFETEWYSSNLIFNYVPEEFVKGDSLKIKYKMY